MSPLTPRSLLLAALAIACAGCSPLTVEWTPSPGEVSLVARGPRDAAVLLVLAGPPNGPHIMPGDPSIWTTVGPDKPSGKGGIEVARVPFDADGVARATIKAEPGGPDHVLVQAVALSKTETGRAIAVSECVAISRKDGVLSVRPHVVDALLSPVWWSFGAVAALVAAGFLLRRVRLPWGKIRSALVAAVLIAAAAFLSFRASAPPNATSGPWPDPPLPLLPRGLPLPEVRDPLDRVTRPGFRELVEGVRAHAPPGTTVDVLPHSIDDRAWMDAWQAAWLLWPKPVRVHLPGADPWASRGLYLTLDAGPTRAGARVLFKNKAGCLWAVDEGEPK